MDYTYFAFYNKYLRAHQLRFGIVLNHTEMCFELWLMGQNAQVQARYWDAMRQSKWNRHLKKMPRYSVLETVLVNEPDFADPDALAGKIEAAALEQISQIMPCIEQVP